MWKKAKCVRLPLNLHMWFRITDESLLPREFLCPHEGKIREAVKAGSREIAWVRIYEDLDVSIRA